MGNLFNTFKEYIVSHPKKNVYKPTSDKFDREELLKIVTKIDQNIPVSDDDGKKILDFTEISCYLNRTLNELYKFLNENIRNLNLKKSEIAEYFIATINRDLNVISNKRKELIKNIPNGSYHVEDLMNFKVMSPANEIGLMNVQGALEASTDSAGLIINYLRHLSDEEISNPESDPKEFAGRILNCYRGAQVSEVLKFAYDDALYNGGFVIFDSEKKIVTFDFDNHLRLKLLCAGKLMFNERRFRCFNSIVNENLTPGLYKYISAYRIKKPKIIDGLISLQFGQGEPKEFKFIVNDMQAAISSYYEFLDGETLLSNFDDCKINEALMVWCALQYIVIYINNNLTFDVAVYSKEDFKPVPRKVGKADLIEYICKLIKVSQKKVSAIVRALEADTTRFNDFWTRPLYPVNDSYILPFYPIMYASVYNLIDSLLQRGGFNLEERGRQFEKYIYDSLNDKSKGTAFPITSLPAVKYGVKGNEEEIDVIIGMKNVVLVGDAKCVHYSMDPINYADAWNRLKEGCEQAMRKTEFVRKNPQFFSSLGDYKYKKLIPFVLTNYPLYTGFSYKGVYVIDSHSFLAYMHSGLLSLREMSAEADNMIGGKWLYNNEDEFSDNFQRFLISNPVKELLMKRIVIRDIPLSIKTDPWKFMGKSAQFENDPSFNLA